MQLPIKAIGLIVLSLLMAACGTTVNVENGELVVTSNFSITETMLNSGDTSALSFGNVELMQNASYDIQEGQIVVSGDLLCADDSREAGSITLEISTSDSGFILAEISDVTSDCEVASSLVTEAQEEMAASLAEAARELEESEASLVFNEITLSDDTLTVAFEVRAPLNSGE